MYANVITFWYVHTFISTFFKHELSTSAFFKCSYQYFRLYVNIFPVTPFIYILIHPQLALQAIWVKPCQRRYLPNCQTKGYPTPVKSGPKFRLDL